MQFSRTALLTSLLLSAYSADALLPHQGAELKHYAAGLPGWGSSGSSRVHVPVDPSPAPLSAIPVASEWYSPPSPASESSTTTSAVASSGPPLVQKIESHVDMAEFLAQDEHSICIIKFHASWCKSCQKFGLLFDQHCRKTGKEVNANVRYASIEWGSNTALCKSLGIKRLPTVHMYHGTEMLTSFACAPKKFQLFKDRLSYMQNLDDAGLAVQKQEPLLDPVVEKKVASMQENMAITQEEEAFGKTLSAGEALIKAHVERDQLIQKIKAFAEEAPAAAESKEMPGSTTSYHGHATMDEQPEPTDSAQQQTEQNRWWKALALGKGGSR